MATNLQTLRQQVAELLDKAEDKGLVSALTQINDTVNLVEQDYTASINENKELLKDYKEVIKNVSFKREAEPERGATEPPRIEDFLMAVKSNATKN